MRDKGIKEFMSFVEGCSAGKYERASSNIDEVLHYLNDNITEKEYVRFSATLVSHCEHLRERMYEAFEKDAETTMNMILTLMFQTLLLFKDEKKIIDIFLNCPDPTGKGI